MSFKGPKIAINDVSGNLAKINSSGELLVNTTVNVGAVTTAISGQTLWIVSGQNTVQLTSGYNIVSVSGNVVVSDVSGAAVKISGETITIGNASIISNISGETIRLTSGFNAVQLFSGTNVVKISGETLVSKVSGETVIAKTSGETIIALISGQTVIADVDLTGATIEVGDIQVDISGQTIVSEISGQKVRFGESGFSYVQLQAFDYTNTTFRNVASDQSGVVSVTASVSANISGQTVRTFVGSGQNAVYITNQSGTLPLIMDASGRAAVTNSGAVINVVSGTGVRVSGEMVKISGEVVFISGQPVLASGGVAKISGETVVSQISGQTVRLTSGFNAVQLFSGTNLVREAEPFNVFTATTLLITGASGGIALLSGECSKVTVRNIGDSGTVMFVGHSGTDRAPWVASGQSWPMFSGAGFWIRDGDAVTVPIPQSRTSSVVRIVSHVSGARVSYMGAAY